MSDEWCAHGPSRNCKDCEIERLEDNAVVDEANYMAALDSIERLTAEIERLEAHKQQCFDRMRTMTERIAELEAELEDERAANAHKAVVHANLQARVEALEGARSNWYCEMCGCSKCMEAEAATEKEVSDGD